MSVHPASTAEYVRQDHHRRIQRPRVSLTLERTSNGRDRRRTAKIESR